MLHDSEHAQDLLVGRDLYASSDERSSVLRPAARMRESVRCGPDGQGSAPRLLISARESMVWKTNGSSEYDVRRPMTETGTNLLGLVKHLSIWEARTELAARLASGREAN